MGQAGEHEVVALHADADQPGQLQTLGGDQRIVDVGHDPRAGGQPAQRRADACRRGLQLTGAVELVAQQVEHHHQPRTQVDHGAFQRELVDLEDGAVGARPSHGSRVRHRGGHQPEHEVGAAAVGQDLLAGGLEDRGEDARGRRLAVGPGDQHDTPGQPVTQLAEQARIDQQRRVAWQGGSSAATQQPAGDRYRLAGENGGRQSRVEAHAVPRSARRARPISSASKALTASSAAA